MKARRQAAVLDIVSRDAVRSQEQLRQRLSARGFDVTQATLSRDIKELGLVKRAADGAYQSAPDEDGARPPTEQARHTLQRALIDYLAGIQQSQQLLVLKTGAGEAQLLALAIDRARLADVLGTIAGDDTVLVIARAAGAARHLVQQFEGLAAN
ncbi:MAG TPA: arginine repressor [Vicinamibacterales bacterium]|nr:arginine repressor [Vicinamibacterales bacterium]